MAKAFVLVDCAAGTEPEVVAAVRNVDGVTEAHVVAGDFDAMLELEGETVRDLLGIVTQHVRPLEGVGTTRTYVSLE